MSFKQPSFFYLIFSLELWERFGFYGLQAILTIFLIKKFSMSEKEAITLFSSFTALLYGLVSLGGWLGDKVLGTKRTIKLGLIILTLGYIIISLSTNNISLIYLGLSTIAIGNCLFKANPSTLLSICYNNDDKKIETAFILYYMAINIGSFFSMLLTPWIASYYGWNTAFFTSVIGLLISLINFLYFQKHIKDYGSKPDFEPLTKTKIFLTSIGIFILIIFSNYILKNENLSNNTLLCITLIVTFIIIKETIKLKDNAQKRMIVALVLMIESIMFFILYNQMPTSLNFFALKNVKRKFLGFNIEPIQYQALNPLWIILASPILTTINNNYSKKLPITFKYALGMISCSISFIILPIGILINTNQYGLISPIWLIVSYAFQSLGELMISGLGLSMISQLIPSKLRGFSTGAWFLTTSISSIISGKIANLTSLPKNININKFTSLNIYYYIFFHIGIISGIFSIFMIIISPILNSIIYKKTKKLN